MYFLTVGPETPVAAAMPLTDSPLLALLLISSTLSTPIISFPDLLMSKSDRIDNCRSKAAVGAGLTISENFRLPEWKAAFTIFVNQTLPNTRVSVVAMPGGQVRVRMAGEEVAVHDPGAAAGPIVYEEAHYLEALEGKRWADGDIREAARANLELLDALGAGDAE